MRMEIQTKLTSTDNATFSLMLQYGT